MKKLAAIALITVSGILMSSAQVGTVNFTSVFGGAPNPARQVTYASDGLGVGSDFTAYLYLEGSAAPAASVAFSSALTGYFLGGGTVNYGTAGTTISAVISASNADGSILGSSAPFDITLGGVPDSLGIPGIPSTLANYQGFTVAPVAVPEPATVALLAMGAGFLFFRRRNK